MYHSNSYRSNHGLDDQTIMRVAPSVFAEQPHQSRGEHYGFIPTSTVLQRMREEGFVPVYAAQSRTRIADKREFTRHMLRLRQPGAVLKEVGDTMPEIVLVNSHDGSSSYQIMVGLFRLACSNGMVVADAKLQDIRVRHTKRVVEDVIEGSFSVINELPQINERIIDMRGIKLNQEAQAAFAQAAALMRWGKPENVPVRTERLLDAHRYADGGDDLWHVFNRVQENIVKGGISARTATGKRTSTRGINSVNADLKVNRDLWELAANIVDINKH